MTASELLALLGHAWPRLLLYPGGLAAFVVVWFLSRVQGSGFRVQGSGGSGLLSLISRLSSPVSCLLSPVSRLRSRISRLASPLSRLPSRVSPLASPAWWHIAAVAGPWLGLALLPLPEAVPLDRPVDLLAILALLEVPLLLTIGRELGGARAPERAARRLATALNSYPPLILATLALGQPAGSFDPATLMALPAETAAASAATLHWIGAVAWTLVLPPALHLGPFAGGPAPDAALALGLRLRGLGLALIAALPWLALLAAYPWLLPLPPLGIAAILWAYGRLTTSHAPRAWARAYLALDAALLAALLWAAADALQRRVE